MFDIQNYYINLSDYSNLKQNYSRIETVDVMPGNKIIYNQYVSKVHLDTKDDTEGKTRKDTFYTLANKEVRIYESHFDETSKLSLQFIHSKYVKIFTKF